MALNNDFIHQKIHVWVSKISINIFLRSNSFDIKHTNTETCQSCESFRFRRTKKWAFSYSSVLTNVFEYPHHMFWLRNNKKIFYCSLSTKSLKIMLNRCKLHRGCASSQNGELPNNWTPFASIFPFLYICVVKSNKLTYTCRVKN